MRSCAGEMPEMRRLPETGLSGADPKRGWKHSY